MSTLAITIGMFIGHKLYYLHEGMTALI
jgi:hypothetical protein